MNKLSTQKILVGFSVLLMVFSCIILSAFIGLTEESWKECVGGNTAVPLATGVLWRMRHLIAWLHLPWTVASVFIFLKKKVDLSLIVVFSVSLIIVMMASMCLTFWAATMPFFPRII